MILRYILWFCKKKIQYANLLLLRTERLRIPVKAFVLKWHKIVQSLGDLKMNSH